jgi:ACS family hexuronate transporter-like MFS transporter
MARERAGNFRFTVIGLMTALAAVNYIDRGAISYAATFITEQYHLDRIGWGAVLGYFGYGYMAGGLIGGALGDRFGAKRIWIAAGVSWSIFEIATAYAGDLGLALLGNSALAGFAVIRILFGFSEGPTYSMINKSVGNWTTPSERGFALSLGLISTPIGALLTAPVAVALLSMTGDWRIMFWVLGFGGLVIIAIFAWLFTDLPEDNPRVTPAELKLITSARQTSATTDVHASESDPDRSFFGSPTMILNTIGDFTFMYVSFMLLTWTPKYLQDQFGFTLSSLWYLGMIPWIGPCFTVLLGGRISDWILRTTGSLKMARSWFASTILLATTICFLCIPFSNSAATVIILMSIGNSLNALTNSIYWAVILDTAPRHKVGTWSGIMQFFANTATILAPTITGILASKYGYSAMFVATAIVTSIGMVAMLLVSPGRNSVALPGHRSDAARSAA